MGDYYGPASSGNKRSSSGGGECGYPTEKRNRRDDGGKPEHRGYSMEDRVYDTKDRGYRVSERFTTKTATTSDDWNCLECSTWNYGTDYECTRCEAPQTQSSYDERNRRRTIWDDDDKDRQHRSSSSSVDEGKAEQEKELDEFGRFASKLPKKNRWPPCFETGGSAFVLDTRSGMFYESISQFFYDPKSKLYYGNKQGVYFRYNSANKEFEEVQKVGTDEDTTAVQQILDTPSSTLPKHHLGKKMSISINLKTKELPSSSKTASKKAKGDAGAKEKPVTEAPASTGVPKKHAADMDKWSERQVEKRQEEQAAQPATMAFEQEAVKIAQTAKGEPICLLCRRKFPTLEKLQYHEQVSNLHKENLAKQEASKEATVNKTTASSYVDRAQQRRILYGPETASLLPTDLPSVVSLGSKSQGGIFASTKPQDDLGESNIGNKMLQHLGWTAGNSLGRKQQRISGEDSSDAAVLPPAAAMVKHDWERIESLTSNGGKGNGHSRGGVGSQRYG